MSIKYCYRIKYSPFLPNRNDHSIYFVFYYKQNKQKQIFVTKVFSLIHGSYYDHQQYQELEKIEVWDYDQMSCIYQRKCDRNQRIVKELILSQNLQIEIVFTIENVGIKTKNIDNFKSAKNFKYDQNFKQKNYKVLASKNCQEKESNYDGGYNKKSLLNTGKLSPEIFKSGPIKYEYQQQQVKPLQYKFKTRSQIFQTFVQYA